jgi:succinate dehydrogenase / fumarate reductase flavoprotein subunit
MGGIHQDINGRVMSGDSSTPVDGLWAAGECGCVSVHGANRLGSNSLSHCIIWGRITGAEAESHARASKAGHDAAEVREQVDESVSRLDTLLSRDHGEDAYQLKRELWETMDSHVNVYREAAGLQKAEKKLLELRGRAARISVPDKSEIYNTNFRDAIEIGNMIELAQAVVAGALQRRESRGSHARIEYPSRDDAAFLAHTIAVRTDGLPRITHAPVAITKWQPTERKY